MNEPLDLTPCFDPELFNSQFDPVRTFYCAERAISAAYRQDATVMLESEGDNQIRVRITVPHASPHMLPDRVRFALAAFHDAYLAATILAAIGNGFVLWFGFGATTLAYNVVYASNSPIVLAIDATHLFLDYLIASAVMFLIDGKRLRGG